MDWIPDPSVSATVMALKYKSDISLYWTPEEQAVLDEGLVKYASESHVTRFAKIAAGLENKTIRDVALRIKFMNQNQENSKRRKNGHNLSRKSKDKKEAKCKDKKEKVSDPAAKSSHLAARPNVSPYAPAMTMMNNDDGIYCQAIGGPTGELLKQNAQALNQISANLDALQLQDNIPLLCQTRDNIMTLLKEVKDMPEIMKKMPPFHFNINETIANSILPQTTSRRQ